MSSISPTSNAGNLFRKRLGSGGILPLPGVYDMFSARLVARRFEGVFCSGFGFVASAYGLPDIGFVNWRDIVDFATRMRSLLPLTHMLVDIDDGFGDQVIASNTAYLLERSGVSAVMMEDQKRPRRCGHVEGKQILPVDEYLVKLSHVLKRRESLFVVARTDATDPDDGIRRAIAYAKDSTPCLFSAQKAIESYLDSFSRLGRLPDEGTVSLSECNALLYEEMKRTDPS